MTAPSKERVDQASLGMALTTHTWIVSCNFHFQSGLSWGLSFPLLWSNIALFIMFVQFCSLKSHYQGLIAPAGFVKMEIAS